MKQKRFPVSDVPMSSEHQHTRRLPVHYNQGFIDMISSRRSSLWGSRSCSLLFLWYLVYILLDFCFPRCTISSDPRLLDRENTGLRANKLADGQLASESPVIAAIPLTKSESRPFSNHYYLSLFDWLGTQITDRFLSFNKHAAVTQTDSSGIHRTVFKSIVEIWDRGYIAGKELRPGKHKQSGRHTDGEQNLKVSQTYWNEKTKD